MASASTSARQIRISPVAKVDSSPRRRRDPNRRPGRGAPLVALSVLLMALGGAGCYSHRVVSPEELSRETDVRVRVSSEYRYVLRDVLDYEATTLHGRVIGSDPAGLAVDVPVGRLQAGVRSTPLLQRFHIPWSQILEVEARTLDRARTSAALAGVAAVIGALTLLVLGGEAGGLVEMPPGGSDEDRIITVRPGGWSR